MAARSFVSHCSMLRNREWRGQCDVSRQQIKETTRPPGAHPVSQRRESRGILLIESKEPPRSGGTEWDVRSQVLNARSWAGNWKLRLGAGWFPAQDGLASGLHFIQP